MTTVTFRLPDELNEELEQLCEEQDRTKSWFIKRALIDKLEEWRDVKAALKAKNEYEKNPNILLSHDEVWESLGFKKKS
ncbi:MAG: ribbon-helix-helix protein, CopG family [Rickettsiales bacterium]|nr:ribbon-helix-helix protein, CopG family [Rickettsiales bacterium]